MRLGKGRHCEMYVGLQATTISKNNTRHAVSERLFCVCPSAERCCVGFAALASHYFAVEIGTVEIPSPKPSLYHIHRSRALNCWPLSPQNGTETRYGESVCMAVLCVRLTLCNVRQVLTGKCVLAVGPQEDGSESSHLSAELPPLPAHCPTPPQSHRPQPSTEPPPGD